MTLTVRTATDEFAELYSAHFARIADQLHAYLGDHSEAQDLAQEAFCRAYDRWGRIGRLHDPVGWVRRVAFNLATSRLRHLRAARRHLFTQRAEHVDGPSPDRVAVIRALAALPPRHRLALVLHYIGNLSTSEIAQQCDVAEGTVRSWLSRGRERLAGHLRDGQWAEPAGPPAPGVAAVVATVRRRRVVRRSALACLWCWRWPYPSWCGKRGETARRSSNRRPHRRPRRGPFPPAPPVRSRRPAVRVASGSWAATRPVVTSSALSSMRRGSGRRSGTMALSPRYPRQGS